MTFGYCGYISSKRALLRLARLNYLSYPRAKTLDLGKSLIRDQGLAQPYHINSSEGEASGVCHRLESL